MSTSTSPPALPPFRGQLRQDELVYRTFFEGVTDGTYVDVGAHDGLAISNTKFFDDLGWRGVCVEAQPAEYAALCANRPRAVNVFGAAYDRGGSVAFRVCTGYTNMLSGVEEAYHPAHRARIAGEQAARGGGSALVQVPCFRLADVLAEHGVARVDYLSLDVEGSELRVLAGLDLDAVDVRVLSVEDNYGQEADFDAALLPRGFAKLGRVSHDLFYYRGVEPKKPMPPV